jgi:hypothetical protein
MELMNFLVIGPSIRQYHKHWPHQWKKLFLDICQSAQGTSQLNTPHAIIHHSAITPNTKLEKPRDETTKQKLWFDLCLTRTKMERGTNSFPGLSGTVCEQLGRSLRVHPFVSTNSREPIRYSCVLTCHIENLNYISIDCRKTRQAICSWAETHILYDSIATSFWLQPRWQRLRNLLTSAHLGYNCHVWLKNKEISDVL